MLNFFRGWLFQNLLRKNPFLISDEFNVVMIELVLSASYKFFVISRPMSL